MAKDKEKQVNPATAQRRADKVRALKKSRAQVQTQRNEKLARRNPERIQRQIDELKQLEGKGDIKQREKDILADLERDLKAVKKAREAVGGKPPDTRGEGSRGGRSTADSGRGGSVLGKRAHNGDRKQNSYSHNNNEDSAGDTDDEVRQIPMPEDTPPPIPREHRRYFNRAGEQASQRQQMTPVQPAQTTYSSAPQIRDLKKEAVKHFVPNVVRKKQEAVSGKGGLIEPEELDRLEAEGYYGKREDDAPESSAEDLNVADEVEARRLAEEEAKFEREMAMVNGNDDDGGTEEVERRTRNVQMEEVDDEDA